MDHQATISAELVSHKRRLQGHIQSLYDQRIELKVYRTPQSVQDSLLLDDFKKEGRGTRTPGPPLGWVKTR